jgi:hypothetical protein
MIQAAMMFALGFSVCGLIALAASSALARRTRRLAEHRVKQRYATKRLEFETERDELRARNAVGVQRLERDVRKLGDQATAYRLESALKDIEISTLNSDVDAKEEEIEDLTDRLDELHEELRESDRKLAESGTALRAARHALQMKSAEDALGDNPYAMSYDHEPANDQTDGSQAAAAGRDGSEQPGDDIGPDSREAVNIRKVATEIRRIAVETEAEVRHLPLPAHARLKQAEGVDRPPADPDVSAVPPPLPAGKANGKAEDKVAGKSGECADMLDPLRREIPPAQSRQADSSAAEGRFFQAMEQIRTLKKAGSNAAE